MQSYGSLRELAYGDIKLLEPTDDGGSLVGYAATYNQIDRTYDVILPGAFDDTRHSFLSNAGTALFNHDPGMPIGRVVDLSDDAYGLIARIEFSKTEPAQRVRQLVQEGVVKHLSVWYKILESDRWTREMLEPFGLSEQDRTAAMSWGRRLKKLELLELGPVSIPANLNAIVVDSKQLDDDESEQQKQQNIAQITQGIESIRRRLVIQIAHESVEGVQR